MWRCRCGETNLAGDLRCRACQGLRHAAERAGDEPPPPPKRWKAVQVGFFGLGIEDPRQARTGEDAPLSEEELNAYYRQAERRGRLAWFLYALAALLVLGLFAWQVFRAE